MECEKLVRETYQKSGLVYKSSSEDEDGGGGGGGPTSAEVIEIDDDDDDDDVIAVGCCECLRTLLKMDSSNMIQSALFYGFPTHLQWVKNQTY